MERLECMERAEQVLMHTYNRYKLVISYGDGLYLYDTDGKQYLDFSAGIAVFALGYGCQKYNDALKMQVDKVLHTSNYYYNEPAVLAAEKLVEASGLDRVFFTNSGTEAVEGAIKLARKYYYAKHGVADSEIIAAEHSFHGRSMGALSVTGTKKYREAFEPLIGGTVFAEYNNLADFASKITEKTAAIIVETVQGEGGIYPAEQEFLTGLRNLCTEKGILLILDEIQCGMGRTGSMYAYEQYGVKPDIMTTAKALGCGVPVGAFVATEEVAKAMVPGDHGTTYGGNPFAGAAVSVVFDLMKEMSVLENVKTVGRYLWEQLEQIKQEYPEKIKAHRGMGLMQGLEFNESVQPIIAKAMENGLILISAGSQVIRFLPPLVVTKEAIDEMVGKLRVCLNANK